MKKIVMFVVLMIGAVVLFFGLRNPDKEQTIFGPHHYLLEEDLSREDIEAYCLTHGLDPQQLVIYVAEYSVLNTGADFKQHSLPVYNPGAIKSLLATSCSIPVEEAAEEIGEGQKQTIAFHADLNWLKNQPVGSLKNKLVVRYLMSFENADAIDAAASAVAIGLPESKADAHELIQRITDTVDREAKNDQRIDLKRQVKSYVKWISNHISYPVEEIKDSLRGTVINVEDAQKTINLGMGVCTDNTEILYEMLQYKGISSYVAMGYLPISLTNLDLLPSNYIGHETVLMHTDRGYYLVDPTLQNTNENENYTLQNGMKVRGSKKNNFKEDYRSFPMYIDHIEGITVEPSALVVNLTSLRIQKVVP